MEISNLSKYTITLIDGDGIGPEITKSVTDIIQSIDVDIEWEFCLAGQRAYEKYGNVLPD